MSVGLIGLIIAAIGFDYSTLLRSPAPFVDEAWNADRAWALLQTGRAFGSLDAGVFDRYEGYWTFFPWLGTEVHALAFRVLGVSLYSLRFTSFVFGLALLAAVYAIGRQQGGQLLGLLAVFLVATSNSFLLSTHLGRHDIIAGALGFGAIAGYLVDRSSTWSVTSVATGLAVGLMLDIHANGIIFAPTIVLLYVFDHGLAVWRVKRFWGFTVGVCVGIAYYLAVHVLPYPQTYLALGKPFGSWRAPTFLSLDPVVWRDSVIGLLTQITFLSDLRLPILIVALILLLWKGSTSERALAIVFGALVLSFVALIRYAMVYYEILILPAADLLLAAFLIRVLPKRGLPDPLVFAGLLIAGGLLLTTTARTMLAFDVDHAPAYNTSLARVVRAIAPGESIIGSQVYWFGLTDRRYLSWEQLVYFQRFVPGATLDDAFGALRPGYLILDRQVDQYIGDDPSRLAPFAQFLYISRSELIRFLNQHGELIESFDSVDNGHTRVYRITWN